MGVEIRGAQQLAAMSKQLTELGRYGLQRELQASLRDTVKPAGPAIRRVALETLPHHGGLNVRVADSVVPVVKNVPSGVRIVLDKGSRTIDRGKARHPLPHDSSKWYTTNVRPGFFTGTLSEMALDFERGMQKALDHIQGKVTP